jgi:hypothetical protein
MSFEDTDAVGFGAVLQGGEPSVGGGQFGAWKKGQRPTELIGRFAVVSSVEGIGHGSSVRVGSEGMRGSW